MILFMTANTSAKNRCLCLCQNFQRCTEQHFQLAVSVLLTLGSLMQLYLLSDYKWIFKYQHVTNSKQLTHNFFSYLLTSKWAIFERACQKERDNWCWILIKCTVCCGGKEYYSCIIRCDSLCQPLIKAH